MNKKFAMVILFWASLLIFSTPCFGQVGSENFQISRSVQTGSGAFQSSDRYVLGSTLGQEVVIGRSLSNNYDIQSGFWFWLLMDGDVNNDGQINLDDLVISLKLMANINVSGVQRHASVDSDGQIGLAESIYILHKIAESGE